MIYLQTLAKRILVFPLCKYDYKFAKVFKNRY